MTGMYIYVHITPEIFGSDPQIYNDNWRRWTDNSYTYMYYFNFIQRINHQILCAASFHTWQNKRTVQWNLRNNTHGTSPKFQYFKVWIALREVIRCPHFSGLYFTSFANEMYHLFYSVIYESTIINTIHIHQTSANSCSLLYQKQTTTESTLFEKLKVDNI